MKLRRLKIDYAGRARFLGDEVFVWREGASSIHAIDYPNSMFQLISGHDGSRIPGHHTNPGWVTVCPLEKDRPAYFLGVKRSDLRKLSARERTKRGIENEVHRRDEDSGRSRQGGKGRSAGSKSVARKPRAKR